MANKNMPTHDKKHEDNITNRVLVVFSACMVGVLMLMYLGNLLTSTRYMIGLNIAKGGMFVGVALAAWGVYLWLRDRRMPTYAATKIILGRYVVIAGILLTVFMALITRYGMGMFPTCYGTLIGIAFLYLIFHSYPVEFFVVACDCAAGIALLSIASALSLGNLRLAGLVGIVVLAVLQIGLMGKMKTAHGKLTVSKLTWEHKFSEHAYKLLLATPIAMVALVAIGAFGGTMVTYIAYGALATYFFVCGVYYTVKSL